MYKLNPFRPNYPVPPGMFVGRLDEISRLEASLLQTRSGQPSNFMIIGQRGIGKTSLMNYIKHVATGNLPISQMRTNFLVVDIDVDQNTTQLGLIRKIELGLENELGKSEKGRDLLNQFKKLALRVEAGGIKINSEEKTEEIDILIEEFSYSLSENVLRITNPTKTSSLFNAKFDGLLILIDEADNSAPSLGLGAFFKLLTERLQRRGCDKVCIGLAGLTSLRNVLVNSHPSSLRIFDEIELGALKNDEINSILDICLNRAEQENGEKYLIPDNTRTAFLTLSQGYPHFIQQFGYSTFLVDTDNILTIQDFIEGVLGENGAIELITSRYYGDGFKKSAMSDELKKLLRLLSRKDIEWLDRDILFREFNGKEELLDKELTKCIEQNVIDCTKNGLQKYKIKHKAFAYWARHKLKD